MAMTARQIVIGDRGITGGGERLASVAADITGSARNQHSFSHNEESSLGWRDAGTTTRRPYVFRRFTSSYRSAVTGRGITRPQARFWLRSPSARKGAGKCV